mmetsp:Transcript_2020/g.3999  ORF Transcript_2020/g.3999 Transcript_2020/m.3999 type:complete len:521 (-) Transcript_2020:28-1590(-)
MCKDQAPSPQGRQHVEFRSEGSEIRRQNSVESAVASWSQAQRQGRRWRAPVLDDSGEKFDEDYQVMEVLGKGGFGEVCRALHMETEVEVAVKFLRMPLDLKESWEKEAWSNKIRQEVETMRRCISPYIIQVIEAYAPDESAENTWRIALELCPGCDLSDILRESGALDAASMRTVSAQLATAVLHMHAQGVVHRDLKPANIMVEGGELQGPSGSIKVVDFGLAHGLDRRFIRRYQKNLRKKREAETPTKKNTRIVDLLSPRKTYIDWLSPRKVYTNHSDSDGELPTPRSSGRKAADDDEVKSVHSGISRMVKFRAPPAGTRAFAAPEVIQGGGEMVEITVSSDAYSVGAIMRHCATGVSPDEDVADKVSGISAVVRMVKACMGKPVETYRFLSEVPEDQRLLIKGLMQREPEERMTVTQLCQSRYISEAPGVVGNPFYEKPQVTNLSTFCHLQRVSPHAAPADGSVQGESQTVAGQGSQRARLPAVAESPAPGGGATEQPPPHSTMASSASSCSETLISL